VLAPPDLKLAAEWHPLASLAEVAEPWRALAARATEPNVFYEPAFARAAAPVFGADAGAILVWSRATPRHLIGLVPLRIERRRYGIPFPLLAGWMHPFAPLGVPLIDRDHVAAVVRAVLDHIASDPALPGVVLLPFISTTGSFACELRRSLAQRSGHFAAFGAHSRAMLVSGKGRGHDLDHVLGRKKRKDLARQRRRLAETGALRLDLGRTPAIAPALQAFLDLEASGWKGRAGTAAAQHRAIEAFLRQAVTDLAAEGKARGARLVLDDHPIAAALTLSSGDAAWFWKIAYDEGVARASPGVQLALDLTAAFLADPAVACVDSCATPDHPMIDHIWRERLTLADYLIAVDPGASFAFALACRLEGLRRALIAAARRTRDLVRGR
jgi:CelD/BcsL family acetyltransferase involved in cellulose biosynthesis